MHFALTTTSGPADTARASLPFKFAASSLASGDTAIIMLFGDAVTLAVEETFEQVTFLAPKEGYSAVFLHPNAEIIVSKRCAEARGITADMLVRNCRFGGMNDLHAHVALEDTKVVSF